SAARRGGTILFGPVRDPEKPKSQDALAAHRDRMLPPIARRRTSLTDHAYELAHFADLCPRRPRLRAGRGRLAVYGLGRALSRFHLGRRRQRLGPRPSGAGRGAERAG